MHVRVGSEFNLLLFFAIMDTQCVKKGLTEQKGHIDISNSVALCKILLFFRGSTPASEQVDACQ